MVGLCILALFSVGSKCSAVTFTQDTLISSNNFSFDGQDITITNCTLTVEGAHGFLNMHILNGGMLTQTAVTNAVLGTNLISVTGEIHILSFTNPAVLSLPNVVAGSVVVTDVSGTNLFALGTDYSLTATNSFTWINFLPGSSIPDGSTIRANYVAAGAPIFTGLYLTFTNNVEIENGGAIDVAGKGYGPGLGTGAGRTQLTNFPYSYFAGSGGGHGGFGGSSSSMAAGGPAYGLNLTPTDPGSGGGAGSGAGGWGGGIVNLSIGGILRVDGRISADGANGINSQSGGGSGGSMLLMAHSISGAGSISAKGGSGEPNNGGGGGGGEIAIYWAGGALPPGSNSFSGTISAAGGAGATVGGAGTVYSSGQSTNDLSKLVADNGGASGTNTLLSTAGGFDLVITGGAVVQSTSSLQINSLTIKSNSWFTGVPSQIESLTVAQNVVIDPGGGIKADGKGSPSNLGVGAGHSLLASNVITGGGASYGGAGGASAYGAGSGSAYGFVDHPQDPGSGGGSSNPANAAGGAGGGAVILNVSGGITLNGQVSADGLPGVGPGSGGGSGGSVWITANSISGTGFVSVNGGSGEMPLGGGGGGGRVAIVYTNGAFLGAVSAHGGLGAANGGAGTIYWQGPPSSLPQLIMDNAGLTAATNTVVSKGTLQATSYDLTIKGNASAVVVTVPVVGNLFIGSNSWLTASSSQIPYILTVTNNAVIQSGGGILFDSLGNSAGQGLGAGRTTTTQPYGSVGSGGGYGGFGGSSVSNNPGGNCYGAATAPVSIGSGGGSGNGNAPVNAGGAGGGAIELFVTNTLVLDGAITANGGRGVGQNSGGGSGGSVWLIAGSLTGSGIVSANGGDADLPNGGGGGGGRVALYYKFNTFTGALAAHGGAGANYGGAGTVFVQSLNAGQFTPVPTLTIDNAGKSGTNTPLPVLSVPSYDLTISGGGAAVANTLTPSITLRNLLITSNSWLISTNSTFVTVTITNATIQAGGGIQADGYGFNQGAGAGRTSSSPFGTVGSGGGHGGGGGASIAAGGGVGSDSLTNPQSAGSPGGAGANQNSGGGGGGAFKITVMSTLALDGKISVSGTTGPGVGSGGGAGGSIWLTVGTIKGAGSIVANGGAGDLPYAGGGGGGRIALYFNTNQFTGAISAFSGAGAFYGGAGTIYVSTNSLISRDSQIIVDNGGSRSGTNTFLIGVPEGSDVIIRGAAGAAITTSQLRSLLVASNSLLVLSNTLLSILANATIQTGGVVTVDGLGFAGGGGTGAGHSLISAYGTTASGGGYGGYGGASFFGAPGGTSYGSPTSPTDAGSGGGNTTGQIPYNQGGAGGGVARLTVTGLLTLDGRLSADGLAGFGPASGGGSGGTVNIIAGGISGAGVISASGGAGDPPYGGGGGGGRVSVNFTTNQFTGSIFARGGSGGMIGGAGTIFLSPGKGNAVPEFIVDNGGQTGTNTPVAVPSAVNLTVSGGAVAYPTSLSSLYNLTIRSNSWLAYSNSFHNPLTVFSNALVERGGGISLNRAGSGPGTGTGAGGYVFSQSYGYSGSGGGYGGYGANSIGGAIGGNAYGSLTQPIDFGSGGGGPADVGLGGPGGGALHLTVQGKLQLDGMIAANGGDFIQEGSGGGSGGSVWLTLGTFAGGGKISADGGDGDYGQGGGGGGGRIAIQYTTNQFQGTVTAWGGMGAYFGGAGTIYSAATQFPSTAKVVVDNGGWAGTNTPIATSNSFALSVLGGAIVHPTSGPLLFNSLFVSSGGMLTHMNTQSNLDVTVFSNATITADGSIGVNGMGYSGANGGPGAGQMTNSFSGSGAGYGGPGGAGISGIAGGGTYGSATQPTDRGSRGGVYPISAAFCQGGGAVRLQVGGTLAIDGLVTASGNAALIEGGGGGSGGSIWLTARKFTGAGMLFANGGPGDPTQGGGGGGGRIAIYSLSNSFTGFMGAFGGAGATPGGNGTIYVITNIPIPQVIAQTPSGVVETSVASVDLTFGSPMDFSTVSSADFSLDTPNGPLAPGSLNPSAVGLTMLHVTFPSQSDLGYYQIEAGPAIADIYGQNMAAPYVGSFAIVPPLISGRVVDTNGAGVPFLTIQVSSNAFPILTDSNGYYSLEVYPNWSGTITPERGGRIFIPPSRTFANVSNDMTNQNFIMATSAALALNSQTQGGNINLSWYGLNGVSYQVLWSSNLVNWVPYNAPVVGTNGPAGVAIPIDATSPTDFFRFRAGY